MTDAACVVAGHFGEWLQGRLGPDGPLGLVTLPCAALTVRATRRRDASALSVFSDAALRGFLTRLGLPAQALPAITCSMPPGAGAGASTATLVAVARWAGYDGPPDKRAQACLRTEGATDPLMWPAPDRLLWASREARIVRALPPPAPCEILGGFWGAPVATDPADTDFADISDLVDPWERAAMQGDLPEAARIASLSCDRCTAGRGPGDPMHDLGRELGALGYLRAHTGSARGLVFGIPAQFYDPELSFQNPMFLEITLRQDTGEVTVRELIGPE